MNELEQLDEEIKQLNERVEQLTNFVESTKAILEAAEKERDRLADWRKQQDPKFERVIYEIYSHINIDSRGAYVLDDQDINNNTDLRYFENNNYFHSKRRAQEVADKINFLLKLERLHDTFCPNYKPDWNDGENKYFVFYDNDSKCYAFNAVAIVEYEPIVYFPTRETAQKVCDILNAEQEEKQNEVKNITYRTDRHTDDKHLHKR